MKKFFSMMMIAAAVFAFAACEKTGDEPGNNTGGGNKGGKLATPELTETHTETTITVAWGAVENAESYIVNLSGKTYTTEACEYTFEGLNAGKYTIRVAAKAEGYEDSDFGKIEVELTGLTEADWFTQTLSLPAEGETVDYGNGEVAVYQPYNGVKALWKGTGVADIKYGLFETEALAGTTDVQIKSNLNTFEDMQGVLDLINSEDGLEIIYGGCIGSTSYTGCVLVTNEDGVEFFTKNEITTAEAVATEATKAWLGTYTAYTEKVVDLTAETNPVKDQRTDFTFTVTLVPGTADQVMVDGVSIIGEGTPAYGQVIEQDGVNYLYLINQVAIADIGNGYAATWLSYCDLSDGKATFVLGDYGAISLAMADDGTITYEAGAGELQGGLTFEVAAFDVIGLSSEGKLGLLQDSEGNGYINWKHGEWKDIKKSASAQARVMNASARTLSVGSILPMSVVY